MGQARSNVAIRIGLLAGIVAVIGLAVGCASDKPKPMAQPSSEQVKGNADRAFDRLKQEEGERRPSGM
ncbi:MAG: hypothetical protein KIT40_18670 [Nitrospira sp.]|nr:hypothetical protein [Nitrospira sp.]